MRVYLISAACVFGPALLAAVLLLRDRFLQADREIAEAASNEQPGTLRVLDSEDHADEPTADEEEMLRGLLAWLADRQMQNDLDDLDNIDLPIKLKQAIRKRVIAGERLADVINLNWQREQPR